MNPDEHTNQEFFLEVGDGHQLYIQDWGNKDAKTPIVYLHGGPGNGCDDRDKTKFDPATQRVIFHDQRGSGKSLPTASLDNNTSQHLIADLEMLVQKLALKKFILCGGSWGSTLSLLYAISHPEKVAGIVIDGVFTSTTSEYDWLDKGGWRIFFPEVWEEYSATVPQSHKVNPTAYHLRQALGADAEAAKKSSYAYQKMELSLLKLDDKYNPEPYDKYDPTNAKIEMHYMANRCFVDDDFILRNAQKLTMPVYIVQGRYDMVCTPEVAYKLDQALPNSHLVWTINGHLKQHESKTVLSLLLKQLQDI